MPNFRVASVPVVPTSAVRVMTGLPLARTLGTECRGEPTMPWLSTLAPLPLCQVAAVAHRLGACERLRLGATEALVPSRRDNTGLPGDGDKG
jgi:hypothetical protein